MSLKRSLYEGWGRNQRERRQCDDGSGDKVMHSEDGGPQPKARSHQS